MINFIATYICRPLSIVMSVYMINLSIDAADMEVSGFDPAVNEIESMVELVLEVLLDQEDALPEYDEPDPETATCLVVLMDHTLPAQRDQVPPKRHLLVLTERPVVGWIAYSDPVLARHCPPPQLVS